MSQPKPRRLKILFISICFIIALVLSLLAVRYYFFMSNHKRFENTIYRFEAGTSGSQIENSFKSSSIKYEAFIPSTKDLVKGSLLIKSGVPLSEMKRVIGVRTPVEQTRSCVSYSKFFVYILDKNDKLIKTVAEDQCVERIF